MTVTLTNLPAAGTTISTSAAVTLSVAPPSPTAQATPSPIAPTAPGICVLFFVPFSGNLNVCPAGKVGLQYPAVQIGSNKVGGLGPCARYPAGVPAVPMLDQQFGPIGL